jgi:hypothetical protein
MRRSVQTPKPEIVNFTSKTGLSLQGLLFGGIHGAPTVIHVHGSCGNFLSFSPLLRETSILLAGGINVLSVNTSACDCIREGFRGDKYEYVGGAISEFGECVHDIGGAIEYALTFSSHVVLQGHSLGCDRVVHYQLSTEDWRDTVLLSPCDSYRLHEIYLGGESVEAHIARLKQSQPIDNFCLLPRDEYGIRNKQENYRIPVTLRTFLSIAEGPPFQLFRLDCTSRYFVKSRAFVGIGKLDDLQTADPNAMFDHLAQRFNDVRRIVLSNSDHEMEPEADQLFQKLRDWIKER